MKLGVNIDHVATLRQARRTFEPDPITAAEESESAGCDSIVCHLRKDRRHILDEDVLKLRESVKTKLNLEMSLDKEILTIACRIRPDQATLVPENRQEITTEGGLDMAGNFDRAAGVIGVLIEQGIDVSLFIDPEHEQVRAAFEAGVKMVEFHTGSFAEAFNSDGTWENKLEEIRDAAGYARSKGLICCAGHGLNYNNVRPVASLPDIEELNIGHSIVSKAVFTGMREAVSLMKELIGR